MCCLALSPNNIVGQSALTARTMKEILAGAGRAVLEGPGLWEEVWRGGVWSSVTAHRRPTLLLTALDLRKQPFTS